VSSNGIRKALLGATWLSVSGYLTYVLNFAANLVLARLLFPRDFGAFALAVSAVELLSILAGFSFSQGIIQMGAEDDIVDTAFVLTLWTSGALLLVGGIVFLALRVFYQPNFAILFFSLFVVRIVSLFAYVYSALLERELHYAPLSQIRVLAAVLGAAAALVMASRGTGVWSLFDREMVTTVVTLGGLMAVTRWVPRFRYNPDTARTLWVFGYRIFLARTLESVWYRSGSFLLGVFGGVLSLGFYDRARYLAELGHYVVSFGAVQVAFPVYARLQSDVEQLSEAYRLTHYFLIRLMYPMLIWVALFPREILSVLYGARWLDAAPVLQWLALYAFLFPIIDNIKVLLTGIGKLQEAVWMRVWQAAVTIVVSAVAIPVWTARGVAVAVTLGDLAALGAGYIFLSTSVRDLALGAYARPTIAAVAAAAAIEASRRFHLLGSADRLAQIGYLGAAGILYCVILVLVDGAELQKNVGTILRGLRRPAVIAA
jgi:O-antigen/teichoic acid export membrane protein